MPRHIISAAAMAIVLAGIGSARAEPPPQSPPKLAPLAAEQLAATHAEGGISFGLGESLLKLPPLDRPQPFTEQIGGAVAAALKTRHDIAMNAIRNLK